MSDIWNARITSWRGISIGAVHYYARLEHGRQEYEIERIVNQEDADKLTKLDGGRSWSQDWKTGAVTNRFDTREEVERAVMVVWNHLKRDGDVILDKLSASYGPPRHLEVLAGPEHFVAYTQAVSKICEAFDWYDGGHRDQVSALAKEWEKKMLEWEITEPENQRHPDDFDNRICVERDGTDWVVVPDYDEYANETYEGLITPC